MLSAPATSRVNGERIERRMGLTLDHLGQTAARDALLTLAAGELAPAPREEPRGRLRKNSE